MNRYAKARRKIRARRSKTTTLTHQQLAAKARSLGMPAFCAGWSTETLLKKIEERQHESI